MLRLIEGEEFRYDFKIHCIETVTKVEFDKYYYLRTFVKKPDWIFVKGTEVYGTVPMKADQKDATLAVLCENTWGYGQSYVIPILIMTQEEYDTEQIDLHIARCKEPLENFEKEYPEKFQEWVGQYVFS